MAKKGDLRVGTSGYQYDHWKGNFYPDDLSKKYWLEYYTKQFDTVEMNNTFYHLPEKSKSNFRGLKTANDLILVLYFRMTASNLQHLNIPDRINEAGLIYRNG